MARLLGRKPYPSGRLFWVEVLGLLKEACHSCRGRWCVEGFTPMLNGGIMVAQRADDLPNVGSNRWGNLKVITILVADDDHRLQNMLRRTLSYEGFHVATAGDGREALA